MVLDTTPRNFTQTCGGDSRGTFKPAETYKNRFINAFKERVFTRKRKNLSHIISMACKPSVIRSIPATVRRSKGRLKQA